MVTGLRAHFGMTQDQFSEVLGITQGFLSKIEAGECVPNGDIAYAFAALALHDPKTKKAWQTAVMKMRPKA